MYLNILPHLAAACQRLNQQAAYLDRARQMTYILPSSRLFSSSTRQNTMFNIGFPEMIVILVVALLVVGPDKLPELARSLAKGVNELRGAMNQIKESLSEESKVISSVKEDLRQTAVQMKDKLLEEDLGSPRQPAAENTVIEMETGQAKEDSSNAQHKEEADTLQEQQEEKAATMVEETEKRVIGKNPELTGP